MKYKIILEYDDDYAFDTLKYFKQHVEDTLNSGHWVDIAKILEIEKVEEEAGSVATSSR